MIDRIQLDNKIDKFHQDYIAARKPCILSSIDNDLAALRDLKDFDLLADIAGNAQISVEPISEKGTFGTAATKQDMPFKEFLKKLQNGEKVYLTTQYSEAEDDAIFNEPLISLKESLHVSVIPELGKHLVPAKINLWLGASTEGTSSGLHHDFHDNFYILLAGEKKFRIFPPSWKTCEKLRLNGRPHEIFDNGLISYDGKLCSDSLTIQNKAQIRLAVRQDALNKAKETNVGVTEAEERLEEAEEAAVDAILDDQDAIEDGEFFEEEEYDPGCQDGYPYGDDDDQKTDPEEEETEVEKKQKALRIHEAAVEAFSTHRPYRYEDDVKHTAPASVSSSTDDEPPSFSSLSSKDVAQLLANEPTIGHEFTLKAGELLYLPASYFHEVISTSGKDDFHMAVNYWFYPPDGPNGKYQDAEIMDELRSRATLLVAAAASDMNDTKGKKVRI